MFSCLAIQFAPAQDQEVKVYGEIQVGPLLRSSIAQNPEIGSWNAESLWDGTTGATLQTKTLGEDLGDATLWLDGQIVAYADSWGQFWFKIQPGQYTITTRCQWYVDCVQKITVPAVPKHWISVVIEPVKP